MATTPKRPTRRPEAQTQAAGEHAPKPRRSAEDIAASLRVKIQEGALEAGEWLREARLCDAYSVGRSTVREALRILGEDGLVRFERNRGAYVAAVTLHEMFDLFELRAALYGLAARFACFHATEKQMSEILARTAALIEACERRTPAEERVRLGGEIFAMLASTASDDARMMIASIHRKSRWHYSYAGLAESPGGFGPVEQWRDLEAALRARDADRAADAARAAVYFMKNEVMRVMVARGLGPAPAIAAGEARRRR